MKTKTCTLCGQTKVADAFSLHRDRIASQCKVCKASVARQERERNGDRVRERDRANYHANGDKERAAMRARSKTTQYKAAVRAYHAANPHIKKAAVRRYQDGLRREALENYGGSCARCGEKDPHFLVLDHIADNGTAHRKSIPGGNGGNAFYRKLRVLGYPAGLQVLCANCNWRKERARRKQKSEAQRRYYEKLKSAVLARYGSVCVCCGETDPIVLTLDHVNNDGAAHRREVSPKYPRSGTGMRFYSLMRQRGYPDGLQTLCWNCNTAKSRFGSCPHAVIHQTPAPPSSS